MSTPFDVRRWAEQAGIHTTGGFSVVAECVTLDELQRFADIAIATAAKHWQRTHAITALAMEERQEMSTPFNPEWLKPGAAVEVSMDNLAAYHAQVQRLMEENAALRAALAEPEQEPVAWVYDCGNGGRMYAEELDGVKGWMPLYTAPPQRKPLTEASDDFFKMIAARNPSPFPMPQRKPLTEEEIEQAYRHIYHNVPDGSYRTTYYWIEQGIRYAEQAHGIGEKHE